MQIQSVTDDILAIIKKDAPIAASIIGSASPLAGFVLNTILHIAGVSTPQQLSTLSSDPDLSVKLKQVDAELDNIDYGDHANARSWNATTKNNRIIPVIAVVYIIGFFIFTLLMVTNVISDTQTAHQVFDILSNATMMILAYFFGSCHSANR